MTSSPYLDFPRMLQVETIARCNATCVTCPSPYLDRPEMPTEMVYRLLDQIAAEPGVREVHPFFTNEPLLDRRLFGFIDYLAVRGPHVGVHLYTNASLLTERNARALLEHPTFRFIAFSLDGASKEVFERARPGLNWDKVRANCDRFLELRAQMGREDVHVKCVMTVSPVNAGDVDAFRAMWTGRVPEVMVMGSDGRAGMDRLRMVKAGYKDRVGFYQNDPRWPCRRHLCHQHSMYILSTGDVVPCCKDATGLTVVGNVFRQSIREVWHSERFNALRAKLEAGLYDERACKVCPFRG